MPASTFVRPEPTRHRRRDIPAILVALAVACLAAGCARPEPEPAGVPVALTLEPDLARGRLTIAGTTDLPDGAVLLYEARHENWTVAGEPVWLRSGQIVVADGRYRDRINVRRWPPGAVDVWVSFQSVLPQGSQPAGVTATYGAMGERLVGDNVSQEGPMKRIELTVSVEPDRR